MEQHPIPRQITTFEFKLIGFMTLKQFLYLVVSFPLAYIVYILFPIPLVNFLLGLLVAIGGVVMAFFPIRDRSIDVWIKNLWKRLQNPTQYYYQKKNEPLYFLRDLYFLADPHHMIAHIESREKLSEYLSRTRQRPRPNFRKKQIGSLLNSATEDLHNQPLGAATAAATVPAVVAATAGQGAVVSTASATPGSSSSTVVAQSGKPAPGLPVQVIPPGGIQAPATVPYVQSVITPPQTAPQIPQQPRMITEIEEDNPPVTPQIIPPVPPPVTEEQMAAPVIQPQIIPPQPQQQPQPQPLPPQQGGQVQSQKQQSTPFFMGVIYTSKKIPLPGVLVYVKGQDGNPIRLMKTNPHGVFATYSPIPPASYTFEIKDPNGTYFFDTMNVQVNENNPAPFEFRSKEIL